MGRYSVIRQNFFNKNTLRWTSGVKLLALAAVFSSLLASTASFAQEQQPVPPPVAAAAAPTTAAEAAPSAALPPPAPGQEPRSPGLSLPADTGLPPAGTASLPGGTVAPKSASEQEADIRDQAFKAAITGLLPLQPAEIRKLLEQYDKTKQAVEVPIYPYPEPEIAVLTASLDPGTKPPEIKVAVGTVTTLSILDATGEPWPIQDMSWAGNFDMMQPEAGGNVIRITPMSDFTYGNISLRLLKLKTPVVLTLKTHRDKVQYRVDVRIPAMGPMAQVPIVEGGITLAAGNSTLGAVLDGVAPEGAQKLFVDGTDGRTTAYKIGDLTYVRTPLSLLSPGWSSSVSSGDGMSVYSVTNAPVLLLSDHGQVVRVRLSEEPKEDKDDEDEGKKQ